MKIKCVCDSATQILIHLKDYQAESGKSFRCLFEESADGPTFFQLEIYKYN